MTVSLYAHGAERLKIEVGRYGMSIEEAKAAFLKTCADAKVPPEKVAEKKGVVIIQLPFVTSNEEGKGVHGILNAVAQVADLHGDPPMTYTLVPHVEVPDGEYVKTGWYND